MKRALSVLCVLSCLCGVLLAAEPPKIATPALPPGWTLVTLPAGVTRGLTVSEPTLYIGAGPRCTSVIMEPIADAPQNAINLYAPAGFWNVTISGSRIAGLMIQKAGVKIYLGDCFVQANQSQGAIGKGDWLIERCYFQGNGVDPQHDHNTYLTGRARISRSLFYHGGARSLGLGTGAVDSITGTVDHCVIEGLEGYYGTVDTYPGVKFTDCTIIGAVCQWGGAPVPSAADGDYVDQSRTYSSATRGRYLQPIYRLMFPLAADKTPYGAYPFDARLVYPGWCQRWWASAMCAQWWNPPACQPFYCYYPLDDVATWERFMLTPPADPSALQKQLDLHGGLRAFLDQMK